MLDNDDETVIEVTPKTAHTHPVTETGWPITKSFCFYSFYPHLQLSVHPTSFLHDFFE